MFNGLIGSNSSQGYQGKQNIIYGMFPLFLLLFLGKNLLKDNKKLTQNINTSLPNKINMLNEIIPYFSEKEQVILSKTYDVLDIINKFNRIIKTSYSVKAEGSVANMAMDEKMEKILVEMSKYLEGSNKELAQNLIDIKHRIDQTKINVNTYKKRVATEQIGGINSVLELVKCFTPVLDDKHKKTVDKIEKIMAIVNDK